MTISDEYRKQQQELHRNPNYGVASIQYAPIVIDIAKQVEAKSISDYGAGKQNLDKKMKELGFKGYTYYPYDPAFPEYGEPKPADLVCCNDVLEHIEPPYLDAVFKDLERITLRHGLFTIHTGAAGKTLPDGRNAHLIQKNSSWWLPKICKSFEVHHLKESRGGFWIIVSPLNEG